MWDLPLASGTLVPQDALAGWSGMQASLASR